MSERGATLLVAAGEILAALYCLYSITFRWNAVKAKYGTLDLMFWAQFVVWAGWLVSALVVIAVWIYLRATP